MKTYQSHKVVEAAKIESIRAVGGAATSTGWQIEFVEEGEPHVQVSNAWMQKHQPKCGGYLVVYGDGYMSFSPAQAFETGYTQVAKPVQVDGESFEMGGVQYQGCHNHRVASFEEVTRPVIKWLNDNGHPHNSILIDQTSAALSAEEIVYGTNDYLKD